MQMLLFARIERGNMFPLLRFAHNSGLGNTETFALGNLLLYRLTLLDILADDAEELNLATVAGEHSWLCCLARIDPLNAGDSLTDFARAKHVEIFLMSLEFGQVLVVADPVFIVL